jgi:4-hydroxy-tetrahydrodipicolinate synthase
VPNRALHGIIPALVTPFREDERIDYGAWQRIIDTLIAAGVDGLFVCGSSGEFYALSPEERVVALRFCQQEVAGRVPLCANVGAPTTAATVELAEQAEAIGIDYLAVVTPYYIRPTQTELVDHYAEVCRSVRIPVLAYNYPDHGGIEIEPGTLAQIAERCPNLAGVKDSSGILEQTVAYRTVVPGQEMTALIGNDALVLPALEQGCAGAVAASANIAPALFVDLYRAFREGDRQQASRLQSLAEQLAGTLGLHTFPAMVKEGMRMAGLPAGPCRKPIGPAPGDAREKMAEVLTQLREQGYLPAAKRGVMA